jgi:adenylate cyclase class 2
MMAYEKYRTVYELDGQEITLDEMPYGTFTEIEGTDPESIRRIADALGLDWEKRIIAGYVVLFASLKEKLRLTFQDLTFENFKDWVPTPADLGVAPADL